MWQRHHLLLLFLANGHLPREPHQSHLSDKKGDEAKPGLCTDLEAFTFRLTKTTENLSSDTV